MSSQTSTRGAKVVEVDTRHGPAKAHLEAVPKPAGALVMGHGAASGISSQPLATVKGVALSEGFSVVLVEQPYRVAGRRSPAPAPRLDEAWKLVIENLRADELRDLPLIVGGQSAGARVACRTAADTAAVAVLCISFPLRAPGRKPSSKTADRRHELDAVKLPTLVVQGDRDPFGMPAGNATRRVVTVPGNHSLKTDLDAVATAVRVWLTDITR
jgi:predicted alpha/beta-hydrolase family hydrolase